jgi:L-threonylcarbamoyladenylate synthase
VPLRKEGEKMLSKYIDLKNNLDYEKLIKPAKAIKEGKLVVLPTETVYGLGANALNKDAVNQIFKVKGRKSDNPLIVHISDIKMLDELVEGVNKTEKILIDNFWPGPLTIVFKKKEIVPNIVTGNLDTVAIRMPSNTLARKLIEYANVPIAAPSANVSGKPSGTQLDDIKDELDGKVEYMIDSGMADIGVESTVVKVTGEIVHILRPGKVTKEEIESLGLKVEVESQVLRKYK